MNLYKVHFVYLKYWLYFNDSLVLALHHPLQAIQKHYKYETTRVIWLLYETWLKLMITVNSHVSNKLQEARMLA